MVTRFCCNRLTTKFTSNAAKHLICERQGFHDKQGHFNFGDSAILTGLFGSWRNMSIVICFQEQKEMIRKRLSKCILGLVVVNCCFYFIVFYLKFDPFSFGEGELPFTRQMLLENKAGEGRG